MSRAFNDDNSVNWAADGNTPGTSCTIQVISNPAVATETDPVQVEFFGVARNVDGDYVGVSGTTSTYDL